MKMKLAYILLMLFAALSLYGQYGRNYPMGPWHHNFTFGWGNYVLWLLVIVLLIAVIYLIVQMGKIKKRLDKQSSDE